MALRLSATTSPSQMHYYAKKLNNSAASYIELGQHNEAIKRLKQALHLIKQSSSGAADNNNNATSSKPTNEQVVCCCSNYCSLNECMVYSEENTPVDLFNNVIMDTAETTHNVSITASFSTSKQTATEDDRSDHTYIHQRPLYITPRCLVEGYNLGRFLSLLVLFNLALAHHLKFVSISTLSMNNSNAAATTNSTTRVRPLALRKVLRLYELTYNLLLEIFTHERQQQCDDTLCTNTNTNVNTYTDTSGASSIIDPSLRFSIIICNNLSQVHKILQNQEKHKRILRKLLSMLMYVVDVEREVNNNSSSTIDEVSSSSLTIPTTTTVLLPWSRQQRGRKWLLMDLDGFLQNTVPIILQDNCAMVA